MSLAFSGIDWNKLLQGPDTLPVLAIVGTICLLGLTAIIAVQWRKAQQTVSEARLKRLMVERGYTAEEITTILASSLTHDGHGKDKPRSASKPAGRFIIGRRGRVSKASSC